jgi:hypothetical protein
MPTFATYRTFIDPEMAEELTRVLDEHGIPYRVERAKPPVDLAFTADQTHERVLFSIPPDLFVSADRAQESMTPAEGNIDEDHYLNDFSDDELIEVLHKAREWHPADVTTARRLLASRGVDIEEAKVAEQQAKHLEKQRQPIRASFALIAVGFIFSLLGGLIGLGIGWSLVSMKERDATGKTYHRYDHRSRDLGRCMIFLGLAALPVWWFFGKYR